MEDLRLKNLIQAVPNKTVIPNLLLASLENCKQMSL